MPNQNDTVVVPMPDDQCDIAIAQYTIGQNTPASCVKKFARWPTGPRFAPQARNTL